MFDMILKFGSYIVDGLREYCQPVLIYIPPNGELRGGAWVVLDTKINPEYMEMYADKDSRLAVKRCCCFSQHGQLNNSKDKVSIVITFEAFKIKQCFVLLEVKKTVEQMIMPYQCY